MSAKIDVQDDQVRIKINDEIRFSIFIEDDTLRICKVNEANFTNSFLKITAEYRGNKKFCPVVGNVIIIE